MDDFPEKRKYPKLPDAKIRQIKDAVVHEYEPVRFYYVVKPDPRRVTFNESTITIKTRDNTFDNYDYAFERRAMSSKYDYNSPISGSYNTKLLSFKLKILKMLPDTINYTLLTNVYDLFGHVKYECNTCADVYPYIYDSKETKIINFTIIPKCIINTKNKTVHGIFSCVQIATVTGGADTTNSDDEREKFSFELISETE